MSDIFKNTPIGKYDKNDPRYLKVSESEIARSKSDHANNYVQFQEKNIKKSLLALARAMQVLQDTIVSPDSDDLMHLPADERAFYILLSDFRKHLSILSSQDTSKDIAFINQLSFLWDGIKLSSDRRTKLKHAPSYLSILNALIQEIETYGSKDGSSLGFYLKEHRNTDWFPIPYLKMLHTLHKNARKNQEQSPLFSWQNQIGEILIELRKTE